jgi:cytoskeletal protein RodZ
MGKNYLVALENDSTREFASQAYIKGFLRIYTTYLGLNPDDMIRMYEKHAAQGAGPAAAGHASVNGAPQEPPRRRTWRIPLQKLALPAILLALILIATSIINRTDTAPQRKPPAPPAPQAAVPVQQPRSSARPQPAAASPEHPKPVAAEPPAPDSTTTTEHSAPAPPAEPLKSFIVRMKVLQNGTLTVTIDTAQPQRYELTAGDAIEWKAEKQIALDLSNAGGVEVELNGRPLRPLGGAGRPAFVVLDPDGVRP